MCEQRLYEPTCVTSCHMLTVNLLEPRDWSSGQVPDSVEHISSMDPVMIYGFLTVTDFILVYFIVKTSKEHNCQVIYSKLKLHLN